MEKEVHFYSGPGLKLTGILDIPPECHDGEEKRPGIVFCHGPLSGRSITLGHYLTLSVASWLVKAGYVVLRFNHRGVGESEGTEYRMIPMEQVEDIRNAVTFMQCQAEVDARRIGLWGAATGGANATYVAGIDTRVKCIVSVSGMGDLGRWMRAIRRYWEWREMLKMLDEDRVSRVLTGKSRTVETPEVIVHDPETARYAAKAGEMNPEFKTTKRLLTLESAEAIVNYQPGTVADRISPRAAMWVCAGNDTLVPIDESRSMYEKAGEPKKLVVLEGEEHHGLYHPPAFERMMSYSTEWFDTHLRTG